MSKRFTKFSNAVAAGAGSPLSFIAGVAFVLAWAVTGPLFGFSNTWQLVINTSTTIITFLMVFLIQNTQNRDNGALQAKLDELIRARVAADNKFIGIEHLADEELKAILEDVEKNARLLDAERSRRARTGDRASSGGEGDRAPAASGARKATTRASARTRI